MHHSCLDEEDSSVCSSFFINSYVPHDNAVDGILMHMRGPTPFANARRPSF